MNNQVIDIPKQEVKKQKDNCLTLMFKNDEVRIVGKITSFWLAANDVYTVLTKERLVRKVGIDELIEAGVREDTISVSELGIVVNFLGLIDLVKWGEEVNPDKATEFKGWVFEKMFPEIWSWTDGRSNSDR